MLAYIKLEYLKSKTKRYQGHDFLLLSFHNDASFSRHLIQVKNSYKNCDIGQSFQLQSRTVVFIQYTIIYNKFR